MSNCPHCQKAIEIADKHLGALYTCPHCKGVFFVGWDGQPEIVTHEPEPAFEGLSPEELVDPGLSAELDAIPPSPDFFGNHSSNETPESVPSFESAMEVIDTGASGLEGVAASSPPPEVEEAVDFNKPLHETLQSSAPPPVDRASGDFSEVTDFANSEDVAGPMTYVVDIKGLEVAETFERLREAVTDSRFGWDASEVMSRVKQGHLVLRGLNPTKASLIVNRIKYLSLEISWKQEVFGESSPE